MNNLKSTKINAILLAAILVAGTIAAFAPSFVVGAQAQEYYGMERDYKKLDKKDVSVKNVKCNNINVNVNGLGLNLTSVPFLSNLLASEAHADEGERGANSYGSGGSYGDKKSDSDTFKFVCINNNNNTVVETESPVEDECAEDIEACFEEFLLEGQFEVLSNALESPTGLTVGINGQEVTLRSFADICSALETALEGLTIVEVRAAVAAILSEALLPLPEENFTGLAICIAESIDIPVPS